MFKLIMSKTKKDLSNKSDTKKLKSSTLENLTEEQEMITDNAAEKFFQGSEFLDESCSMIWDLLGGNDLENHREADKGLKVEEGYMGIYFQPDEYLFRLSKTRFDVTLSKAKKESILRTEDKNCKVDDSYIRKTDEEIKTQVSTFINNSWKRIYSYFRTPQNHIWQVDFFLPTEVPYAAPKVLTGTAKWRQDLIKEITSIKKSITKLKDAVINNQAVQNNKSLSSEQVTAATIHGAELRLDELRALAEDIENIVSS
tara:strand:+ start:108 stop:875 length:768 start_codon:yes stop_codon:yes gene_type:complete